MVLVAAVCRLWLSGCWTLWLLLLAWAFSEYMPMTMASMMILTAMTEWSLLWAESGFDLTVNGQNLQYRKKWISPP